MQRLIRRIKSFVGREEGPTAVEYAVLLALIIIVCLAAIRILGKNSNSAYGTVGSSIGRVAGS